MEEKTRNTGREGKKNKGLRNGLIKSGVRIKNNRVRQKSECYYFFCESIVQHIQQTKQKYQGSNLTFSLIYKNTTLKGKKDKLITYML
jgi:hypothetical protein